jgi:hypothetical protein
VLLLGDASLVAHVVKGVPQRVKHFALVPGSPRVCYNERPTASQASSATGLGLSRGKKVSCEPDF